MGEDHFRALGVRRGLELTPEELEGCYDAVCQEVHPDAGGDPAAFQRVQKALGELRSPGRRLRHWLEVAGVGWEGGGALESGVAELFGEVGTLLERVEEIRKRRAAAQSALARSLAEREAMAVLAELEQVRERTAQAGAALRERFGEFEAAGAAACREEAGSTVRSLLFLEKWEERLRQAWAQLAG